MKKIKKVTLQRGHGERPQLEQYFDRRFMEGLEELDDDDFLIAVCEFVAGPNGSYQQCVVAFEETDVDGEVLAIVMPI